MVDRIDDLIKCLKELKEEKLSAEQKSLKVFEIFKREQENFNKSSECVYEKIEDLKQEVILIDSKREAFFKNLDKIFTSSNLTPISDEDFSFSYNQNNNKREEDNIKIKRFYKQESYLSELMKKINYQTIYNIFFSFLVINIAIFTLQGVIEDKFIVNFSNIFTHFDGFLDLLKILFLKQCFAIMFVIIINFLIFNFGRNRLKRFNIIFIIILKISFFLIFKLLSPNGKFSIFMRIINYLDNLGCLLKVFAYYLEKVLMLSLDFSCKINKDIMERNFTEKIDSTENNNKSFVIIDNGTELKFDFKRLLLDKEIKNFIFFYFSPTLIYRDTYPMIKKRNYPKIFLHASNMLFSIMFIFLLMDLTFFPFLQDKEFDFLRKDFVRTLVTFCLYSMILLFVVFFGFFHSYLNLSAEVLLFADKNFYSDFFNSLNPKDFMLKLSYYYVDFFEYYLFSLLKPYFSKSFVIIVSYCIVLEYILSCSFNNFCPIIATAMIFCYLSSFLFYLIKIHQKQFLNWIFVTFFTGFSFLLMFVEYIFIINKTERNNFSINISNNNDIHSLKEVNSVFSNILPKFLNFIFY